MSALDVFPSSLVSPSRLHAHVRLRCGRRRARHGSTPGKQGDVTPIDVAGIASARGTIATARGQDMAGRAGARRTRVAMTMSPREDDVGQGERGDADDGAGRIARDSAGLCIGFPRTRARAAPASSQPARIGC